ncbi:apoptosis regulator BAX-like [Amphiura filiformis]|uniref:apoptosis regulator BAX-like n=1 Tax=Amphiura filiformis TaxID=82378 RepID=UPI003B22716F
MAESSAPTSPPAEGGSEERPAMQQQISQEDIGEQAAILLRHFIADRFEREGVENAPTREQIVGDESQADSEVWVQIGSTLRQIGDILDQDEELQRMIDSVPDESPIEAIIAVAQVIFGDGDINWGRIIGAFYFAYRMCVKALDRMMRENLPAWINVLVKEMVKFLVVRFADWIINRGGWQAVKEYFGSTPPAVWNTLIVISILSILYGFYKLRK